MGQGKHAGWQMFCEAHQAVLAASGLPVAITHAEHRFRDLLREGQAKAKEASVSLADLNAPQWSALERFAGVFFHEFESAYAPQLFPAFRREAERRSTGFRSWS